MVSWMKNDALPFWATVGADHQRGGFHERLDLEGHPILDVPKRLMVQGRQIYVYCHAALLAWYGGPRSLVERCVEYIVSSFYRRDGRHGWIHSLAPDGSIASATRDTYAHAFVLLGLAWYYRLTGDSQVLTIVDETLTFLDEVIASARGGYLDAMPRSDEVRRQNPHMHLFESLIALHQATNQTKYLTRAVEIFDLFSAKFFNATHGSLCEYLTEDLNPLNDARGSITEPGHHYEWIWLLRNFQRASGREVKSYCKSLYDHADKYGWDEEGFVVDEVAAAGSILKRSRRLWPHTEALKANIVEGEIGRMNCDEKAARSVLRLTNVFLGRPFPSGWIDHVDQFGRPMVTMIPASTLYHLLGATAEAVRATSESEATL
jgi:mannose-6-phosphate isomerase